MSLRLTLSRLPIAVCLAFATAAGWRSIATILLLAFVIIDLADGMVERRAGPESVLRRAADSLIDRSTVGLCFGVAAIQSPSFEAVFLAYLVINILLAVPASVSIRRGYVVAAPTWHRSWSSAAAIAGLLHIHGASSLARAAGVVTILLLLAASLQLVRLHARLWRPVVHARPWRTLQLMAAT